MPSTEASILRQLNAPARSLPKSFTDQDILPGHKLGQAEYLFTRIKPEMAEVWKRQFGDRSSAGEDVPSKKGKKRAESKQTKNEEKPAYTGPVTDELIAKEKEVVEQGEKVRDIKRGKVEGNAAEEVAKLLALKRELGDITERLETVQVTTAPE